MASPQNCSYHNMFFVHTTVPSAVPSLAPRCDPRKALHLTKKRSRAQQPITHGLLPPSPTRRIFAVTHRIFAVSLQKPEGSNAWQLEAGIVVPGRRFGDAPAKASEGGDVEGEQEEQEEQSRTRVELRVEGVTAGDRGQGETDGCVLGPTVTVTRERTYRFGFDDGLLYKGEFFFFCITV